MMVAEEANQINCLLTLVGESWRGNNHGKDTGSQYLEYFRQELVVGGP